MARLRCAIPGLLLIPLLLIAGCASTAPNLFTRSEGASAQHALQSRQFETPDEERILTVCAVLLQDMGFQIDEAASALGVLSASKLRDANRLTPGERFGVSVVQLGLLVGVYTAPLALFLMDANKEKPVKIEVGITTRKTSRDGGYVSISVAFKENDVHITDPAVYQAFFDQLSKALFVEARES
jgi:hypothetical protein